MTELRNEFLRNAPFDGEVSKAKALIAEYKEAVAAVRKKEGR